VANDSGISGLKMVVDNNGNPTISLPPAAAAPNKSWTKGTGGSSPIIANGVLYYAASNKGRNGTNAVYALDPTSGAVLWTGTLASHVNGAATVGGIHWETPIVVDGRLYIASENGNNDGNAGTGKGYLTLFKLP
jgi:outer membrane protein assembly factor BamB